MSTRVQVILTEEEKVRLQAEARRSGVSLSAWLRNAALERLEADHRDLTTQSQLEEFFADCDRRELEQGPEPNWTEHLKVIAGSRRQGQPDT